MRSLGDELLRELAGAGTQLEYVRVVETGEPGGGFGGVRRTGAVVGVGHPAERKGGDGPVRPRGVQGSVHRREAINASRPLLHKRVMMIT